MIRLTEESLSRTLMFWNLMSTNRTIDQAWSLPPCFLPGVTQTGDGDPQETVPEVSSALTNDTVPSDTLVMVKRFLTHALHFVRV